MDLCPVLVGRDAELRTLEDALGAGGGVVLVAGEAGMGKSRLLRDFADRARPRAVVWGRPETVTLPGPYSVIVDLLEDVASLARTETGEARALAGTLLATGGPEPSARQVAARVRGVLGSLGKQPIVVFEDLQAADELSQAVFAHLARSARDDGALLVAAYRPEEENQGLSRLLDLLTRDRIATDIVLKPLDLGAMERMLEAMWDRAPTPDESAAVERLGEGVPFFVEELASGRSRDGATVIPAGVSRVVEARLARLPPDARALVRGASLMSGAIDPSVLAEACGVAETEVPMHLVDGVRAGLLADREGRLVFRHALVRQAIAEEIVSVERRDLHRRIADAIENQQWDQIEARAQEIARHRTESGDPSSAAVHWTSAGRRALAAGALDEARAAFEEALDAPTEGPARLYAMAGKAEILVRTREFDEARTLLRRVADGYRDADAPADAARALSRLSWLLLQERDRRAIEVLDEGLALARGDDALETQLMIEKGYALVRVFWDTAEAEPLLREGESRAEKLADRLLLAQAHEALAWMAEFTRNAEAADHHGTAACDAALESARDDVVGRTHANQALRLAMRGRCEEALGLLETARDYFLRGEWSVQVPSTDHARMWVLWRMGRPAEADAIGSRLEATTLAQVYGRVVRTWAAVERGDHGTAEAILRSWWEEFGGGDRRARLRRDPDDIANDETYVLLAEIVAAAYKDAPADEGTIAVARAYREMCRRAAPDIAMMGGLLCARIELASSLTNEALDGVLQVEELLTGYPYPLHAAGALELRGRMLGAKSGEGRARLLEAAKTYESCQNSSDRARALRLAAEAMRLTGSDRDEIVPILREARDLAFGAGASAESNRAEALLRSFGVRPRAGRPRGPKRPEGALSPREEEVVALVAAGASNAEISGRLFISERTVEDHVARAQRRLGVAGRAGLAAWAVKHGLI